MGEEDYDRSMPPSCISSLSPLSGSPSVRSVQFFNSGSAQNAKGKSEYTQASRLQGRSKARHTTNFNMSNTIEWKNFTKVEIKLTQVPAQYTTWDIYRSMDTFGNVTKIRIVQGFRHGSKNAFVTFEPLPQNAFWELDDVLEPMIPTLSDQNGRRETIQNPSNRGALLPVHSRHVAKSIHFGHMVSEDQMMTMFNTGNQTVGFAMDLNRKTISIDFYISVPREEGKDTLDCHRLQLKMDKMSVVYYEQELDHEVWTIPMDIPPEMYRKESEIHLTHKSNARYWSEWDAMVRQTEIVLDKTDIRAHPAKIRKNNSIVDIGRWTTYRIDFAASADFNSTLARIKRLLSIYNVHFYRKQITLLPRQDSTIWDLLDRPDAEVVDGAEGYFSQLQAVMSKETFHLSFETRYQLEVCLTYGWLHESNFTNEFLWKLHELDVHERTRAVGILEQVASLKRRFFDPMKIFDLQVTFTEVAGTRMPPRHCTITRSAIITPTMIYFNTPVVEVSNRVIREWSTHTDRFLRVRFAEELCYGQIMSQEGKRNDEIYARFKQVLRNGIVLGDRKYEFLAFGSSQFRERGAYFFAPTKEHSCESIRYHLGQMKESDRSQPAKFCARLGQNFSTTRGLAFKVNVVTHNPHNKAELILPDIKRGNYVFTDGVGKLSKFLAEMIAGEYGLPTDDAPSVFQFRLGGCKGVLTVDPNLNGHEVHLRPSQFKFAAIHEGLEIIRTSIYASASLNRQLIIVLSALGVEDEVFIQKMKAQMQALDKALVDETIAINELRKAVDTNQTTFALANMVENGFMSVKEPFMMSMLKLWRTWSLKNLKEKAKISVEEGAFLLGTIDETATLRGHFNNVKLLQTDTLDERINKLPQVFCYTDRKRRGVYEAVEGVCILARNPSLHPGDIRVVRAVDVPHLHHIKNAIVFPQTGDRDISNMCSGGDLDGDDYLLISDKALIPDVWNHPPMDFTGAKPRSLDRHVTVDDMTDFFIDYMKSDKLAQIAHRHLALADYAEAGVMDERCKALAELHSFAVDYPKSGVPVTVPSNLRRVKWPHFMEKHQTDYISRKILGQLYDLVVKEEFHPEYDSPFDKRVLEAFDNSEELLKTAEEIKYRYDNRLRKIMTQHDIRTEFEVWSGFVMTHNNEKRDYKFGEELGTLMEAIRLSFREECERIAGGREPCYLHPFVSSMYAVTARQVQEAAAQLNRKAAEKGCVKANMESQEMPFISFPWLFMQDLGKIARGGVYSDKGAHHIQRTQQYHQTKPNITQEEIQGDAKTKKEVVAQGGLFRALEDARPIASGAGNDNSDETEYYIGMIEKNIRGQIFDRPKTSRDLKIEALRVHHDRPLKGVADTLPSVETKAALKPDICSIAYTRGEFPDETKFMSDESVQSWIADSDKADILLPHEPYQDLLISQPPVMPITSINETSPVTAIPLAARIQDGDMRGTVIVELDLEDGDSEGAIVNHDQKSD